MNEPHATDKEIEDRLTITMKKTAFVAMSVGENVAMTSNEYEIEQRFFEFEKFMEPFGVDYVALGFSSEDKDYWNPMVNIHKSCKNMDKIPEYWGNKAVIIHVFNGEIPSFC